MTPLNDLERLLSLRTLGPEKMPELFRLLRETEILFLLPYHPEMEGAMAVQNGDALPPFVIWSSPTDGHRIPIFSSLERAQEACQKTSTHENQYVICDMPGQDLFVLLSCQPTSIAINPATSFPTVLMDLAAVKEIAGRDRNEGTVGKTEQGKVQLLTPDEYPTKLVQGLFQYLRGCPNVRAAWLARQLGYPGPGTAYLAMLLGDGDKKKVQEDLCVVAGAALPKGDTMNFAFLNEDNAAALVTAQRFTPFYAAPDYKSADPLGPD